MSINIMHKALSQSTGLVQFTLASWIGM